MKKLVAAFGVVIALAFVTGCQKGQTWIATSCKLDDQAPAPCDYDWKTHTGSIHYENLSIGHHVVVVEAQKCVIVRTNPDFGECSVAGSDTREWDVVAP